MDPGSCPHCGGPNPLASTQCQWCGGTLIPPTPPPLRSSITPDFDLPSPPPEDSGPSGLTVARIVVGVIALVTVVAAISISATNPSSTSTVTQFPSGNGGPDTVNVTEVVVNVPTDACGLSGITPGAFSVPAGTNYPIGWWLPWSGGSVPCSVSNVSSDTAGFSIWGNFPLNVTSPGTPLMFTIACPAAYSGVLTLTVL